MASGSELETATLYLWNIQLAEALFPSMATLEVVLRNAVHDLLTYWQDTEYWFGTILHPKGKETFNGRFDALTRKHGSVPTAAKIVSEMSFGFWTTLVTHYYHGLWWDSAANPLLKWRLPNHPNVARDTRKKFAERLEYFLELRNRMMHQEAIFDGVKVQNKPSLDYS